MSKKNLYRIVTVDKPRTAGTEEDWILVAYGQDAGLMDDMANQLNATNHSPRNVKFRAVSSDHYPPGRPGFVVYRELSEMLNVSLSRRRQEEFIDGFMTDHPLLQQFVIDLMLDVILAMADRGYYDPRNEQAGEVCGKIKEILGNFQKDWEREG